MTLIGAAAMVVDGRVCWPGWLQTSGGRIADCGPGTPPEPADLDLPDAVVVPGFVDMHVHGGGGASYTDASSMQITGAAAFHRRHGTTSTLASLVTAAPAALLDAVRMLAESTRQGGVAGIHLEGPWLSPRYCRAHDHQQLRDPDAGEIDALLAAGDGAIRMVTLAPELHGGIDAIGRFVDAGVVVAVGHTDAGYEQTRRAIGAGATVGTHLFNAMRPLQHREPGPALALMEDPRVTVELIADGVHVHPALIRRVVDVAGPQRVALITDATAAAGSGDGPFRLGGLDVDVVSGVARVRGTSTIAGSTATMDRLFRAVAGFGRDPDTALTAAVQMTSTTPARVLGLDDVGSLRSGRAADLVVLNQDL
ncbi:MAG: N-acetylglucosamine-6-phosphate deacetylase, partial [Mycobacterium sp.]